jgi:hypothetical protein
LRLIEATANAGLADCPTAIPAASKKAPSVQMLLRGTLLP